MLGDEDAVRGTETVAYHAADRPTWRRLVNEKTERIHAFERHILPRLIDGLRPGSRWLEIGCGLGWASAVAADRRPDLAVTATDLVAPYLADHARRLATFFGVEIHFAAAHAGALPFPDGTFDRVFSQMVLYRVGRPQFAIWEAYRVLAPRGRWIAVERAAPWGWPWSAQESRRVERRNQETGLGERAYSARAWHGFFAQEEVPATFAWATREGRLVRWLTNAVRAEHLMVEVEKP